MKTEIILLGIGCCIGQIFQMLFARLVRLGHRVEIVSNKPVGRVSYNANMETIP